MPRRNRDARHPGRSETSAPARVPNLNDPRWLESLARDLVRRGLCSPAIVNLRRR